MVIFHSYVSLPEGNKWKIEFNQQKCDLNRENSQQKNAIVELNIT